MPAIKFITAQGEQIDVSFTPGVSVMQAAIAAGIDGIVAECGGSAMCATCHVYLEDEDSERFKERDEIELEMLECTASERTDASRLSCQLMLSDEDDGLVVHLPEAQI